MSGLWVEGAQAQDSTLTRLIRQNLLPLTPSADGRQYSGAGWDKLQASIQKSQLVLLGEDHGLAQVPPFAAAVGRVLQPAVYVAEVDPYVAQAVTRLAAQPGLPLAYRQQYPESLCFASMAEEFELMRTLRGQQARLVGLDQVFGSSAAPFYAQLASLVKSKVARAYFQQQAARYQAQTVAFEQAGKNEWVMEKQSAAAIDSLLALTKAESPAAQKMAQDYAASHAIYKSQSHQARLNLMKRNLLDEVRPYQAAGQPLPKMLFKFGAYHLARGLSPVGWGEFYDVGSLVQNLADAQGQKSLHVFIIGKQGSQLRSTNPYFPAKQAGTYSNADNDILKPFVAEMSGAAWAIVDLRPARRALTLGQLHVASPALERTILGYDYLVVIPKTTASHAI